MAQTEEPDSRLPWTMKKGYKIDPKLVDSIGLMCGRRQQYLREMRALEMELAGELKAVQDEEDTEYRLYMMFWDAEIREAVRTIQWRRVHSSGTKWPVFRRMLEKIKVKKEVATIREATDEATIKAEYNRRKDEIRAKYEPRREALKERYLKASAEPAPVVETACDEKEFLKEKDLEVEVTHSE